MTEWYIRMAYNFMAGDFNSYSVKLKGEEHYYISGFATTSHVDLSNEMIDDSVMTDLKNQFIGKNVKIDFDHEVWRDKETGEVYKEPKNLIPLGRVVDAQIKSKDGYKGVWIKVKLNSAYPMFDKIWKSVKQKFIDAFSIAFKPLQIVERQIQGKMVKVMKAVQLLNVALTGVPMNPAAKMDAVMMKALNEYQGEIMNDIPKDKKLKSEDTMKDEQPKEEVTEQPAVEEMKEKDVVEENSEDEPKKEESEEETQTGLKSLSDKMDKILEEMSTLKSELADSKKKIDELEGQPVMKSEITEAPKEEPAEPSKEDNASILKQIR